jgi:hypothetical protein
MGPSLPNNLPAPMMPAQFTTRLMPPSVAAAAANALEKVSADFRGDGPARRLLQVENGGFTAGGNDPLGNRPAEAGGAAGDDRQGAAEIHGRLPDGCAPVL